MTLLRLVTLLFVIFSCNNVANSNDAEFFSYDHDTSTWQKAAEFLAQGMNPSANACANFFDFACGNWKNSSEHATHFVHETKSYDELAKRLINQIVSNSSNVTASRKNLKMYYDGCMDAVKEQNWKGHLYNAIEDRLGPLPWLGSDVVKPVKDLAKSWELLGQVERQFVSQVFLNFILADGLSATILPSPHVHDVCRLSYDYLIELTVNITNGCNKTWNETQISKSVTKILDLCNKVSQIRASPDFKFIPYTHIPDLTNVSPHLDLDSFFVGFLPPAYSEHFKRGIKLTMPNDSLNILEQAGEILEDTDILTLRAIAILSIFARLPDLNETKPREDVCLAKAKHQYAPVIANLFLEELKRTAADYRQLVQQFALNIVSAFRLFLNAMRIVELDDIARMNKKLDNMRIDTGIPQWIDNETEVMDRIPTYDPSDTFYQNEFKGREQVFEKLIRRATKEGSQFVAEVFTKDGVYPMLHPDATYSEVWPSVLGVKPQIHIAFPMSFPPVFEKDYPAAIQYGTLGFTIAHELAHAFDPDNIRLFQPDGSQVLKESSFHKMTAEYLCLETEYSKHCTADRKHCVNGTKTLPENIADIVGLKVAYLAYKYAAVLLGEDQPVPPLQKYTNDQLFFLSNARIWCERGYSEHAYKVDTHAPNEARVEVSYSMVSPFAMAFKCIEGVPLNRMVPCPVWGDVVGATVHKRMNEKK